MPKDLDPTKNVLDLVGAGMQRQDDLRELQAHYIEELARVRQDAARRESELRHKYEAENRALEADRLNAIRQVDQQNVQHAAEVQQAQATALATQVLATAEASRAALTAALEPIIKDIADLRRAQYEQAGSKQQVGETRLNYGAILGVISILLVIVGLYLAR